MIKACLFDLDGVIVDTAKFHYIAWKKLANEMGFDFSEQDNERLKGISRMASLDILLEIGKVIKTDQEKEILAAQKNENYLSLITEMGPEEILPGAQEFLKECRRKNIKTALGSASKNAMTILNRLRITDLFDAIIDGTNTTMAKPHPEVFLKGAEALNIPPSQCVVFEDAEAGVEAALAAQMKCVGIGSPQNLGNAHLVIDGLHQMNVSLLSNL